VKTAAIVFEAPGVVGLRDIEMPAPTAGEVQVRTEYSTVSVGTERWLLRDLFFEHMAFPLVPGYQRVGRIVAVGDGVDTLRCGERVMATRGQWTGPTRPYGGAHAALVNSAVERVFCVPTEADAIDASGAVIAHVGLKAARRAAIEPGEPVVVFGDGLIGQCTAQAARLRGADVMLVGHHRERLALAARVGLSKTVNRRTDDVREAVRAYAGRAPIAAVFDAVQDREVQMEYLPLLEPGRGQIVYCGYAAGNDWANLGEIQRRQLTTHSVWGIEREPLEAALWLLAAGGLRLRPLITHLVDWRRGPEMYRLVEERTEPFLGITFDWSAWP
jgi:2-desacetyl-2-hydroxyethyl bacteriochlorophyllide A dehydrogenase